MQEPNSLRPAATKPQVAEATAGKGQEIQLLLGLIFGVAFGFLLQKGGVAKYEVLIGVLLLTDMTVIKVMMSAVVVGMIGIYGMRQAGLVSLHLKPTRLAANTLGGILFGCGFALAAYCPGTSAAALGQGNFDALAVIFGLMAGSYLYAEASRTLDRTVNRWGNKGKLTWPRLFGPASSGPAGDLQGDGCRWQRFDDATRVPKSESGGRAGQELQESHPTGTAA
jgi:hypothetical protein